MVKLFFLPILIVLFVLGGCASKDKKQMEDYRLAYLAKDFEKASQILKNSNLKDDKKSILLWHLENGTLALSLNDETSAIEHFQMALELVDRLYTTKLTSKAASVLINDASDDFYGASYERSYAHYFLSKSLYQRYLKTGNKLDLQGARATILAWDSYFAELQRSLSSKTLYSNDLMLKVFGGQIHEVSEIKNDKQIALQLYKDALVLLKTQGGIFPLFNSKNDDYIKHFQNQGNISQELYSSTSAQADLQEFLEFKILSLTKEVRSFDFEKEAKNLNSKNELVNRAKAGGGNVVLILEEGLIPRKVGKPFNFGLKGAVDAVDNPATKAFITSMGAELVTAFAMNKLGLAPTATTSAGSFIFAHTATKLAVMEAAIEFELPMIEKVPSLQRMEVFILDQNDKIIQQGPLPVVSDNGEIAKVVLEEDVVARYVKTGIRVASKHLVAIVAAMKMYQTLNKNGVGDLIAKTAAMTTYVGASKGLTLLEKADTRHWATLPQAIRMTELKLDPGIYKIGLAPYENDQVPIKPTKTLGDLPVTESASKKLFTFKI